MTWRPLFDDLAPSLPPTTTDGLEFPMEFVVLLLLLFRRESKKVRVRIERGGRKWRVVDLVYGLCNVNGGCQVEG